MNQVTTKQENPLIKLHEQLEARTSQFTAALPAHIPVERFKRVLLTAIQNNPALATADRQTLFNSAMRAAQDGLLPDGREGAMVIYKNKVKQGTREFWIEAVQWMPMIAGIRKKVRNSGEIATWDAYVVYEKDAFEYELGDEPFIKHKPHMGPDAGKVVAAYSVALLKSGEKSREVMTVSQIERIRAISKAKDSGPWKDHYSEMCRKTVARRHSKVLPMSTDLDDLLRRDDDLYDMDGASDKTQAPAAARPQLVDFVDMPQNAPMTEDPKKAAPPPADPETGELPPDNPVPEFGAADAYALGAKCREDGGVMTDCPKQLDAEHKDAWKAGFQDTDEQMMK
jgi:recombination protein RecT